MREMEKRIREKLRAQNKEDSTADVYWYWWQRYEAFFKARRLGRETKAEQAVELFLSEMANQRNVSAGTQNQAFSAVCYVYANVYGRPLVDVSALRAKAPQRIRDVVDQSELIALFDRLHGVALLAASMMYAASFRIGEVGNIRMKDISFERRQIVVRAGKGNKDRLVPFPELLHEPVRVQMESMQVLWQSDRREGLNGVSLPNRWGEKSPSSRLDFAWWYLFASDHYSKCPHSGRLYRHHRDMGHIARQIKQAAQQAGIPKRITSHCLRHSYATHSLEGGVPIHVVQRIMGHSDPRTTMGYIHLQKDGVTSAKSPLESLLANSNETIDLRRQQTRQSPLESSPQLRLFTG